MSTETELGKKQGSRLGRALWARLRGVQDPSVEGTPSTEKDAEPKQQDSFQELLDANTCEGDTGSVIG